MTSPGDEDLFEATSRAAAWKLAAAWVLGPLGWVVALSIAAVVVQRADAIEVGLLVTGVAFLVGVLALLGLRGLRIREERRFATRA